MRGSNVAAIQRVLDGQRLLSHFPREYVETLAKMADEVRYEKDDVIFLEGDESGSLYLIVAGSVALEITVPGRTLVLQTLGPGDEFGWSSILPDASRRIRARALGPVQVFEFNGAELRRACEENAAFGYLFMRRLLKVVAGRLEAARLQLVAMPAEAAAKSG
jgi:CRP-like cAMP-binding protein